MLLCKLYLLAFFTEMHHPSKDSVGSYKQIILIIFFDATTKTDSTLDQMSFERAILCYTDIGDRRANMD